MPDRIIMALKLSSTVRGMNIGGRGRREAPAALQDSDVGPHHEIYRKSFHFCGQQKVCEKNIYNYTVPGILSSFLRYCIG